LDVPGLPARRARRGHDVFVAGHLPPERHRALWLVKDTLERLPADPISQVHELLPLAR